MTQDELLDIIHVCHERYSSKVWEHALRVASIVQMDTTYAFLSEEQQRFVKALAYAHDLLEDTQVELNVFTDIIHNEYELLDFQTDLVLLTHTGHDSYYDYVSQIVASKRAFPILIKKADMKDHLSLKETLTERLKRKYYPVLPMLMGPHYVWR